ncbi:hypothetical protein Rhal01_03167 [Rubritalea halochordaticola]|uniref:ADP-ribosylglycohydrolase family protein n=1 Tax=Rubritalea halochordaticola TaxID=714537 RepID=A0ABP9V2T6_9BACT
MKQSNQIAKTAGDKVLGCLLGQAVGDSIGLPTEGMKRGRIAKLGWAEKLKHRFILGWGMVSDDTEHMVMVVRSLVDSGGDVSRFRSSLAARMRWWFICLPAGVGLATAKACMKNLLFMRNTGVFSAGNGPCMRAGIIGVYAAEDKVLRGELVTVSTRLTHTDPKALYGSMAVAEFCAFVAREKRAPELTEMIEIWNGFGNDEWQALLDGLRESLQQAEDSAAYADRLGCERGVSGYVYHTIPVLFHAGFSHGWSYEDSITQIIALGGDTDTTAAILGACAGGLQGVEGIPQEWLYHLRDFPNGVSALEVCADSLVKGVDQRSFMRKWVEVIVMPLRNLLFVVVVLVHGFARLLPACVLR